MNIKNIISIRNLFFVVLISAVAMSLPAWALVEEGHEFANLPTMTDTDGGRIGFSEIKGIHTLFVFFSMYSDGTGKLMEILSGLHNNSSFKSPLQVIGISVDPSERAVAEYLSKRKVPFQIVVDTSLAVTNRFGVEETPVLVLVGPGGKVLNIRKLAPEGDGKKYIATITGILGAANEKNGSSGNTAAMLDEKFQERMLLSTNAVMSSPCPINKSLVMYVSGENVLLTYDYVKDKRVEHAAGVAFASWSHDGKYLVFGSVNDSGIWIKELDGKASKVSPEGRLPVVSRSGNLVAFVVQDAEIWMARLDTGKRWRVSVNGKKVEWTPDGNLLIITDEKGRVWLVSPYSRATLLKNPFD